MEFTIQFIYPKSSLLFHPSDTRSGIAFTKRQYGIIVKSSDFIPLCRTYQPSAILYNLVILLICLLFLLLPTSAVTERIFCLISAEIQILPLSCYQTDNIFNPSVPRSIIYKVVIIVSISMCCCED